MMFLKELTSIRYVLPLCFLGLLGFILARGLQENPSDLPSVLLNKPLPMLYLENISTKRVELVNQALKPTVTLLNVWATWCSVCQQEKNILEALAKQPNITLVSLAYKDTPEQIRHYFEQNGNPYQHTWVDRTGKTSIDLGIYGTPELYLIDQQGYIQYRHTGLITESVLENDIQPMIAQMIEAGALRD